MIKTIKQTFTVLATVFTVSVFAVAAIETVAQADDDPPAWPCTRIFGDSPVCGYTCIRIENPRGDFDEGEWVCAWLHLNCSPNNPECILPRH